MADMTARTNHEPIVGHDIPAPSDPRFPLGTRVRIAGVPDDNPTLRHLIGYTGTICRVGIGPAPRNLTVCFDWETERPDSGGFWTFAAQHLALLDDGTQLGLDMA